MSLYIGKDNNGKSIIHITSTTLAPEILKEGRSMETCFLSSEPLYILDSFLQLTLSSTGIVYIPTDKHYYFDNSIYNFFMYVYDSSIGSYIEAGNSDCYVIKDYQGNYLVTSENSNTYNQSCFIFCTKNHLLLDGSITISRDNIVFNTESLFGKKYLYFLDSYITGSYENILQLQSGKFVGVLDLEEALSIVFNNKSIQYKKSNSTIYTFASEINSTRLNGISNIEVDKTNLNSPSIGFSVNIPGTTTTNAIAITVAIPYSYSFYQLGSDISGSAKGYMRTTFKPTVDKVILGRAPLPNTYFRFEYTYSLNKCSLMLAPQPGAGILISEMPSYPKARVSSM